MTKNFWLPRNDGPDALQEALDALLAGDLPASDVHPRLQPVAEVLGALNAAPEVGELAGHARALAEFRLRGAMSVNSRSVRRRPRLITSLLSAKAAAAAAVAAVTAGGFATAAFAGMLPAPAQQFAHNTIGAPSPAASHSPQQATPSGPDATGPAAFGLCTAYSHAQAHGSASQQAVAFRNLATAAGGAGNVTAYCAGIPHPGASATGAPATHRSGPPSSHPSGPPASHPSGPPASHPSGAPASHPSGAPASHPSGPPASPQH